MQILLFKNYRKYVFLFGITFLFYYFCMYPFFDENLYISYQLTTTMKMGMDEKKQRQGNDKCLAINTRSSYLEA